MASHNPSLGEAGTPSCSNCDALLSGPFCAQCGQRVRGRLSTRKLLGDLLAHGFSVESALWRTIAGLARNPGALCRDYVSGRRARYVNPLRYCLMVLAVYLLVSVVLGIDPTKAVGKVVITGDTAAAADAARARFTRHIDLMLFLALPLFALLLRIYYRKAGYNYAEVTAYALFVVGQSFLYATMLLPFLLLIPTLTAGIRLLIQVAIFTWSATVFFGGKGMRGWIKALGVQFLYVLSVFPVALLMILIFLATGPSS